MAESQDRPFVFGVDLDGVCGNYNLALRDILAEKRGVSPESITMEVSWNFPEWGLTPEEYRELHTQAVRDHHIFANMAAMEGVKSALWELSNSGIWIRIITHRLYTNWGHKKAAQDTVEWLDKVDIPYREICFVSQKTEVDADAYIEDSPANIDALRKAGKEVIVYDQPYNKELADPRVRNWQETKELVKKMALETKGYLPERLPGVGSQKSPLQHNLEQGHKT